MASTIPSRGGTLHLIEFRRTDQDRRPPSRVLTPKLMGDPDPDRLAKAEAIRASISAPSERGKGIARRDGPNAKPKNRRVTRQRADEDARG